MRPSNVPVTIEVLLAEPRSPEAELLAKERAARVNEAVNHNVSLTHADLKNVAK